jgi:hypothetical protein
MPAFLKSTGRPRQLAANCNHVQTTPLVIGKGDSGYHGIVREPGFAHAPGEIKHRLRRMDDHRPQQVYQVGIDIDAV